MSDIPPADELVDLPPEEPNTEPEAPAIDPVVIEALKAAVAEALKAMPQRALRPGTVTAYAPATAIANVLLDGDTAEVPAQVIGVRPSIGQRVMVEIVPGDAGSTAFVTGVVGGAGDPAGVVKWWPGAIPDGGVPGHLVCDGTSGYAVARYPALAASGMVTLSADGQTFTVPDLRGRTLFGIAGGSGRISTSSPGGTGGSNSISSSQLPSHSHDLGSHTHSTPAHQHSLGSHSHSFSGSTASDGSHAHGLPARLIDSFQGYGQNDPINGNAANPYAALTTNFDGAHSHSFSGTTGAASGSTGFDGSGTSGAAFGNTGSTGSGAEFLPPHMAGYWLIKT